jgi:FkbM family methyltransferase
MFAPHRFLLTRMPGIYFMVRNLGRKAVGTRRNQRKLFSSLLRPGDLVFDVGANIGEFSGAFSDNGARVIAIEPQPRLGEHLRRRFRSTPTVTVVGTAVSDHAGEATLYLTAADALATLESGRASGETGPGADLEWGGKITVPLRTLDDLMTEHGTPVLVKIDVEGHELGVVKGLTAARPSVFFEVNRPESYEVIDVLSGRGYTDFYLRPDERPDWVNQKPMSATTLREFLEATDRNFDILAMSPDTALVGDRRPPGPRG